MGRLAIALLVLLLLAGGEGRAASAPPAPRIRVVLYNKAHYLHLGDVARFYGMRVHRDKKTVLMRSQYSTVRFTVNSRTANLNGVTVHLSRAIAEQKGALLLGKSDFHHLLDPVLRSRTVPRHRPQVIVVDPGHGGKDVGAIGVGSIYEKNITLAVAQRLATALRERGFVVYMTRTTDQYVSLDARCKFANARKADFFISLHCNATKSTAVHGVETYINTPLGDVSIGQNVPSSSVSPSNKYDLESVWTGYHVQRALLQKTGAEDRGLKRMRYYVIRNVNTPAMLIEMGFLTNVRELQMLRQPARQQQIADAIAQTMQDYREIVK
ncbi:MAG: N-acetylmuramoyl-L-alanine amidase [Victivallales bacterium]|nr:N-acetylmuramoyl-L-alanine amidase [Victivallales bacterium]